MTNEQITQWAREAKLQIDHVEWEGVHFVVGDTHRLQAFATLVRNAALEEAAVKCDELYHKNIGEGYAEVRYGIAGCAKGIRRMK